MEKFQRKHIQRDGAPLNPWYVTGFSDGESSFTYSRSGKNIALYFAIKLSYEDRELLYKLRDFFCAGKIYVGKPLAPGRYSGHTRTFFYYRVSRIAELGRVIDHFDRYPLVGKKAQSYAIWKQMVALKMSFRKPNLDELAVLAGRLSAAAGKYSSARNNAKDRSDL